MALLISMAPAHAGDFEQKHSQAPDTRTQHGPLVTTARWWWSNWTRFAQGRIEK